MIDAAYPKFEFLHCHGVLGGVALSTARHAILSSVAKRRIFSVNTVVSEGSVKSGPPLSVSAESLVTSLHRRTSAVRAGTHHQVKEFGICQRENTFLFGCVSTVVAVDVPRMGGTFFFSSDWIFGEFLFSQAATTSRPAAGQVAVSGFCAAATGAPTKVTSGCGFTPSTRPTTHNANHRFQFTKNCELLKLTTNE